MTKFYAIILKEYVKIQNHQNSWWRVFWYSVQSRQHAGQWHCCNQEDEAEISQLGWVFAIEGDQVAKETPASQFDSITGSAST
jgi:hypothetical protein